MANHADLILVNVVIIFFVLEDIFIFLRIKCEHLSAGAAKPEFVLRPGAIPKADALRMPVAAANAAPVPAIWCAVMGNAMIATGFVPIKKRLAAG